MKKPGGLSFVWAILLIGSVAFLQVQELRPDWHAAIHKDPDTGAACGSCGHHHESNDTGNGEDSQVPLDSDCAFTIAAANMGTWNPSLVVPSVFLEYLGNVVVSENLSEASIDFTARARAPPVNAA